MSYSYIIIIVYIYIHTYTEMLGAASSVTDSKQKNCIT